MTWQNLPESICEVQEEREASAPSSGSLTGRGAGGGVRHACLSPGMRFSRRPRHRPAQGRRSKGRKSHPGIRWGLRLAQALRSPCLLGRQPQAVSRRNPWVAFRHGDTGRHLKCPPQACLSQSRGTHRDAALGRVGSNWDRPGNTWGQGLPLAARPATGPPRQPGGRSRHSCASSASSSLASPSARPVPELLFELRSVVPRKDDPFLDFH